MENVVATGIVNNGDVIIIATDSADAGDDIRVLANINITSTGGCPCRCLPAMTSMSIRPRRLVLPPISHLEWTNRRLGGDPDTVGGVLGCTWNVCCWQRQQSDNSGSRR